MFCLMGDLLKLIWWLVTGFFRSRAMLEAEIVALRHQLNVLRRKAPKRIVFSNFDRLVFACQWRRQIVSKGGVKVYVDNQQPDRVEVFLQRAQTALVTRFHELMDKGGCGRESNVVPFLASSQP